MNKTSLLASSVFAMALFGCQPEDKNLGRGPLGKADAVGSCEAPDGSDFCGGQSEGNCWCDDQCDSFGDCCPDKPIVCEGQGFEPCAGLTCGDECSLCDPADPDCFETAVIKMCHPDGSCQASVPECAGGGDGDGDGDFDPCGGLQCGDLCSLCAPNDPDCVETLELKFCQGDGSCGGTTPSCDGDGAFDPCDGLQCGDFCSLCDPADVDCVETAVIKACQPDGTCSAQFPTCN